MKPLPRFIAWCMLLMLIVAVSLLRWLMDWSLGESFWEIVAPMLFLVVLLMALANSFRVFPYRTALVLMAIPVGAVLLSILSDQASLVVAAANLALLGIALFDLATLPRANWFQFGRTAGRVVSLRQRHRVTLTIANSTSRAATVWVRDGADQDLRPEPAEVTLQLSPRSRATFSYFVRPVRRGAFTIKAVHTRVRSRLGMWQRFISYELPTELHVYPDLKQLSEYAVLARTNRLSLVGVRRTRRIGQDNEFERLRDYTVDDNFKHIDWRSTARRNKLTVRDFQSNQSQRVIFLIDCGRMMTNEAAGVSLLDHAFNAMLMLGYVALAKGDSVGLLCFSDEIHGFVPPQSGKKQMTKLLHSVFDRFPRRVESRYDEAFLYLAAKHRRRSLVVLITSVIDEVNSLQIQRYLGTLVGKHLPLGVLLRDRQMFDAADGRSKSERPLFDAAAAAELLLWRQQVIADLQSKGVMALDAFPEEMTAPLINRYLDIKARHLL